MKRQKLICKYCDTEIFVDKNMIMLKDKLWNKICDEKHDSLCADCIEKRLGRKIRMADFKESKINRIKLIPCNEYYILLNKIKLT